MGCTLICMPLQNQLCTECMTWDHARAVHCMFVSLCVQSPSIALAVNYGILGSSSNLQVPKMVCALHVLEVVSLAGLIPHEPSAPFMCYCARQEVELCQYSWLCLLVIIITTSCTWEIFMCYWMLAWTTLVLEVKGGGSRPADNACHCAPHAQQTH